MNRPEAYALLAAALEAARAQGALSLQAQVGCVQRREVIAPSGVRYGLEIAVQWADSRRRRFLIKGRIENSFFLK